MKRTVIATVVLGSLIAAVAPAHAAFSWDEVAAAEAQYDIGTTDNQIAGYHRVQDQMAQTSGSFVSRLQGWLDTHPIPAEATAQDVIATSVFSADDQAHEQATISKMQSLTNKDALNGLVKEYADNNDVDAKDALNISHKAVKHLRRDATDNTPATETVKGSAPVKAPEQDLGASKLVTAPTKGAHVVTLATVAEVHNDSSAKRINQAAIGESMAQANRERTASQHVTAASAPVAAPVASSAVKAAPTMSAPAQAVVEAPVASAAAYQEADPETVQAVNDLIDAHNENVAAIDDHEQRITSNSQRLDAVESHDKAQDKQIERNNKKAMAGIAGALAQTGLHYTDSANSVAAGMGNYAGESAISVGYSHQWGNQVRFSVQNSVDTAHNVGTSASMAIGW